MQPKRGGDVSPQATDGDASMDGLTVTDPRPDAEEAAACAGLSYVCDDEPGIRRRRAGKGFSYRWPDGTRVTEEDTLERIRKLAIPPAYRGVWICPDPDGHLQATGRDTRGRKQYRYHPRWTEMREGTKFGRMLDFCRALPAIRRQVDGDPPPRPPPPAPAVRGPAPSPAAACRGKRCWPPWCGCWKPR